MAVGSKFMGFSPSGVGPVHTLVLPDHTCPVARTLWAVWVGREAKDTIPTAGGELWTLLLMAEFWFAMKQKDIMEFCTNVMRLETPLSSLNAAGGGKGCRTVLLTFTQGEERSLHLKLDRCPLTSPFLRSFDDVHEIVPRFCH